MKEEKMEKTKEKGTLKTMKRFFITTWRSLKEAYNIAPFSTVSIAVMTTAVSLVPLLQANIMGQLINKLIEIIKNHSPISWAMFFVLSYAGVWALSLILSAVRLYVDKKFTTELEHGLEIKVMRKRAEIDLGHYENPEFQNLLERAFNRSIWPMFELAEMQFSNIANIVTILLSSTFTIAFSPEVYIVILLTSLPRFFVELQYGNHTWTIWMENSERQRKYNHLRHHFTGKVGVVQTKLLQASEYMLDIITKIQTSFRNDQLKVDRRRLIYTIVAGLIAACGYFFGLYIIIKDVYYGSIALGTMTFLISALGQMVGAVSSLLQDIAKQNEKFLFAEEMFQVLDTRPFIKRAENPIKLDLSTAPKIEFQDVWFRYGGKSEMDGDREYTLKGINLVIEAGEIVALVGDNGAGKTTLIKLLSRIYDPTKGRILVSGVDLRDVDLDEWSSYLSVFLQDWVGYDFTTRESIAMGRSSDDISQEKAERAADLSEAKGFIETWSKGFDTQLGREFGGEEPSKGQNQKIALARALYREGFVLMLDEPTASVDGTSESRIFERISELAGSRTLILITHRFNTVRGVDKIVVLSDGVVSEVGNHNELIARKALYSRLFNEQAKGYALSSDEESAGVKSREEEEVGY